MLLAFLFFFGFNVFVVMGTTNKCLNLRIVTAEEGCVCFLVVFLLWIFFFFPNLPEKLKLLFILGGA